SFLIDGHYGTSQTWSAATQAIDGGDGRDTAGGDGAYVKPGGGPAPHAGAVYVVAGSAGRHSGGPLDHPAMFTSLDRLGSGVLAVAGHRLDPDFLGPPRS